MNDFISVGEASQPPLSKRGVTYGKLQVQTVVSLDWLRYSVPWRDIGGGMCPELAFSIAVMPTEAIGLTGEVLPAPKGYDTRLGLTIGSLRYHSAYPKQKIGVEFTGRDLDALRSAGVEPFSYLSWAMCQDSKVTRLDIAIDVLGGVAEPVDVHRAFLAGDVRTPAHVCRLVEQHRSKDGVLRSDGATVYVGSRNSDRLLRVYDKARELNLPGMKWTRIELELGGDRANLVSLSLVHMPGRWVDTARAQVRDFCQVPGLAWYTGALDGPISEVPVIGRRDSNRKRWLLVQVLPALRAELEECEKVGDWELYEAFSAALALLDARCGART